MVLSIEQKKWMDQPLSREVVKTRSGFSYIEGWYAISEANRIFGFDGWSSETTDIHCVVDRKRDEGAGFSVTYTAKVRIIVGDVFHEGHGAGTGINPDHGLAHEKAIKEAETDARKRALMQFGNQFGLALYDKEQANVVDENDASRERYIATCKQRIAEFDENNRDLILQWWNSDQERKARRDFELSQAEVDELKKLAIAKAKLPTLPKEL